MASASSGGASAGGPASTALAVRSPTSAAPRFARTAAGAARVAAALARGPPYNGRVALAVAEMGPAYVKVAQAVSARPDLAGNTLAMELATLLDGCPAFPDAAAASAVAADLGSDVAAELGFAEGSMGTSVVAAASIGQVYRRRWRGEEVAVKVRRPGVTDEILADREVFRAAARLVAPVVRSDVKGAVEELFARLLEEADYEREAENLRRFAALYGRGGSTRLDIQTPRLVEELCSERVLVMSWVDGERLVAAGANAVSAEDLPLLKLGIDCTLSQLLVTGVLHADPHGGNLLKTPDGRLAYLDFGLLAEVPQQVREGLVVAVAYLIARDFAMVASLFSDLMLLPRSVLDNPREAAAFEKALERAADEVLDYGEEDERRTGARRVPTLRFDRLIGALGSLAPRFSFTLPPYFLNNARAIGTLEGLAKTADPSFNVLAVVYEFAARRLLQAESPRLRAALVDLTHDRATGRVAPGKAFALLGDASRLSGVSKRRIAADALRSSGGRALAADLLRGLVMFFLRPLVRFFAAARYVVTGCR